MVILINLTTPLTAKIILSAEYRWYITHSNDTENVEGMIRSEITGRILFPDLKWEIIEVTKCNANVPKKNLQTGEWEITNNKSCVFPFIAMGIKIYGCYGQVF